VEQYAESVDTSMSKAIAALVRLGLENQENREILPQIEEKPCDQRPQAEG
jgi:Holliday junction resolvasome RuvABC DNA-binding subunit